MTARHHDPLSANLCDLRVLFRDQISKGLGFNARELAGVAELLSRLEMEALRLEAFEIEAKAFRIAEQASAFLRDHPVVDVETLEAAIGSSKVVLFPGPGGAFARRPS